MALAADQTMRAIAGVGEASAPAVLLAAAVLPTTLPGTPTALAVPSGAMWAELRCVYIADALAASGGSPGFKFFVGDATTFTQIVSPLAPADGYGISDAALVAAGVTLRFVIPLISVARWQRLGIEATEDADAAHPGNLAVSVVWIS